MNDLDINNIEKLLQPASSEKVLFRAIVGMRVKPRDKMARYILIFICFILGSMVGLHQDTVLIFQKCIEMFLGVMLALFGVIFTGYALLQAFVSKQMLLQLVKDIKKEGNEEKTRLQDINENFVYLMLLYIIAIIITIIAQIVMFCMPNSYIFFEKLMFNNAVASFLIIVYFVYVGIILWRMISFVVSIFHLFNIYAVAKIIEIIDEENDK